MEYKISVVIPVYNAEKYIVECIESLLNQTLRECEFIFIDDGSGDQSGNIIKSYQKLDQRIKLISQENKGVSNARNKGLQTALGEYIGFTDADDYIENNMYKTLYESAKIGNCDVVISNLESEIEGNKSITSYPFPVNFNMNKKYIKKHLLPYFLKYDNLNSVVSKIYKKQIITEHKVYFPEKVVLGEDGMFNMYFMNYVSNIKYIDYSGYHYREVPGSATRNIVNRDYFNRALEVYNMELPRTYLEKLNNDEIKRLKSIKLINSVISYIHIYFTPSEQLCFRDRYHYIKNMIGNPTVREALSAYVSQANVSFGRYEKTIINLMKNRSAFGLYCVVSYSRFRNK